MSPIAFNFDEKSRSANWMLRLILTFADFGNFLLRREKGSEILTGIKTNVTRENLNEFPRELSHEFGHYQSETRSFERLARLV